jgi:hypothetical protein
MADVINYRGISYSMPHNDDGVWHYRIHLGRTRSTATRPTEAPREGYTSRDAAIAAAERAIDFWLAR